MNEYGIIAPLQRAASERADGPDPPLSLPHPSPPPHRFAYETVSWPAGGAAPATFR